jgi:hypothetical protein
MSRMYRLAGTALVLGALLWLVNLLYGDTVFEGFRPSHVGDSTWGVVGLVGLVGSLLVMVGVFAVFARQAGQMEGMGTWGFGLSAMSGMIFGVGFGVISTVALPLMSAGDRAAWDFYASSQPPAAIGQLFLVATALYVVGTVMWGWAMTKASAWPTWTGWALVISGVLALLITIGRFAGIAWMPIVADIPYLIFMVLGVYWGWRMAEPMRAMQPAAAAGARA